MSESTAASSIVAAAGEGSRPAAAKRSATSVAVEPTGSKVARTGRRVSIEPMWWWSRISTISAWSIPGALWDSSAWSTSTTLRGAGETSAERPTRPSGRRRGSTTTAVRYSTSRISGVTSSSTSSGSTVSGSGSMIRPTGTASWIMRALT